MDSYGGFVLHVFYILAHRLCESCSSYDNMNRKLKEAEMSFCDSLPLPAPGGSSLLSIDLTKPFKMPLPAHFDQGQSDTDENSGDSENNDDDNEDDEQDAEEDDN